MRKWLILLIGLAAALAATGAAYALAGDQSGMPEPKDSDLPTFSAMCAEEVPDCDDTLVIGPDEEGTIEPGLGEDGPYTYEEWRSNYQPNQGPVTSIDDIDPNVCDTVHHINAFSQEELEELGMVGPATMGGASRSCPPQPAPTWLAKGAI